MPKRKTLYSWESRWAGVLVMLPAHIIHLLCLMRSSGFLQVILFIMLFFSFSPFYRVFFIARPSFIKSIPRMGVVVLIWLLLPALFFYAY